MVLQLWIIIECCSTLPGSTATVILCFPWVWRRRKVKFGWFQSFFLLLRMTHLRSAPLLEALFCPAFSTEDIDFDLQIILEQAHSKIASFATCFDMLMAFVAASTIQTAWPKSDQIMGLSWEIKLYSSLFYRPQYSPVELRGLKRRAVNGKFKQTEGVSCWVLWIQISEADSVGLFSVKRWALRSKPLFETIHVALIVNGGFALRRYWTRSLHNTTQWAWAGIPSLAFAIMKHDFLKIESINDEP